jgi:hypothetical protein
VRRRIAGVSDWTAEPVTAPDKTAAFVRLNWGFAHAVLPVSSDEKRRSHPTRVGLRRQRSRISVSEAWEFAPFIEARDNIEPPGGAALKYELGLANKTLQPTSQHVTLAAPCTLALAPVAVER